MKWGLELLGWGLFVVLVGHFLLACGSSWEFGRHGMPRSRVAADGVNYVDGTPIDPISLAIVRAGVDEETMLVLLSAAALGLAYVLLENYRIYHRRERLRKLRVIQTMIDEHQAKGDWENADQLLRYYKQLAGIRR